MMKIICRIEENKKNDIMSQAKESLSSLSVEASKKAESLASEASSAFIGTDPPLTESIASRASANWEALVHKASEQVYGAPMPWTERVLSAAGSQAAKATDAAAEQYDSVASIFSELVHGREPEFSDSVMSQLRSAFYTNAAQAAASATEAVADVVETVKGGVSSAASAVSSVASDATSKIKDEL